RPGIRCQPLRPIRVPAGLRPDHREVRPGQRPLPLRPRQPLLGAGLPRHPPEEHTRADLPGAQHRSLGRTNGCEVTKETRAMTNTVVRRSRRALVVAPLWALALGQVAGCSHPTGPTSSTCAQETVL